MFVIVSVEEKYKVGKGRGKPAILSRMIRQGLSGKCKQRPKEVRYPGEERFMQRKGEDREANETKNESASMSRSCRAVGLSFKVFCFKKKKN